MDGKKLRTEVAADVSRSTPLPQPVAVLQDVYYEKIELNDIFVSNVVDKKEISRLVKDVTNIFPLEGFSHLKRVRSGGKSGGGGIQIIVCQKEKLKFTEPTLGDLSGELALNTKGLEGLYLVKVPASDPLTRAQFEEASRYWPVTFHEDKRITKLLTGTDVFSGKELEQVYSNMDLAINMAKLAKDKCQIPVGAVAVDPLTNDVIAKSHDYRHGENVLHHAVMTCVDMVARSQGGGAWEFLADDDIYHKPVTESTRHGESGQYLCTGYDVYITREPCVMCAMALVHSRVQRVFYGRQQRNGALGSQYKLHVQTGLNHHYEVYRGVRESVCAELEGL